MDHEIEMRLKMHWFDATNAATCCCALMKEASLVRKTLFANRTSFTRETYNNMCCLSWIVALKIVEVKLTNYSRPRLTGPLTLKDGYDLTRPKMRRNLRALQ